MTRPVTDCLSSPAAVALPRNNRPGGFVQALVGRGERGGKEDERARGGEGSMDLYYSMDRRKMGSAVIINNLDKEQEPTRRDVEALSQVFMEIGAFK